MGGRRRTLGVVALPALVVLSTVLHWLAAQWVHGLWIVPDEAIYAQRALTFWHHGPWPLLHGPGAGYSVLYPVLAGIPLTAAGAVHGYVWLKPLQALVVSLAAVPVWWYGRRVAPPACAFVAAVLTLASPLLLYDGFVMTEVLFYPLAAATLLGLAHALAAPSRRAIAAAVVLVAAAVLTRTQAVAFVPVAAVAVALDAALARDARRLRRAWPLWVLLAAGVALVAAVPRAVGAYSVTIGGGYPAGRALGLVYDHLAYVALACGLAPFIAFALLVADGARGRVRDAHVRALAAVTASATAIVVVQVGVFSARYSPHLLGRDLAALPPLLFVCFAAWAARPRRLAPVAVASLAVLGLVVLAPWDRLVQPDVFADTFGAIVFAHVHLAASSLVAVFAGAVVVAVVVSVRRAPLAPAALVLVALLAASVFAARDVAAAANARLAHRVGPVPDWIDRAARGDVVYVYGGEQAWSEPYQESFWNRRLTRVLSLWPASVPGPIAQTDVTLPPSGRLPGKERWAVAPDRIRLAGARVAHLGLWNTDVRGLTLWRLDGPPRVTLIEDGVQPNGDMTGDANISVYGCRGGSLLLTLLPKATSTLTVDVDGLPVLHQRLAGLGSWSGSIPAPRSRRPRLCVFTLRPHLLLGSTRIGYAP